MPQQLAPDGRELSVAARPAEVLQPVAPVGLDVVAALQREQRLDVLVGGALGEGEARDVLDRDMLWIESRRVVGGQRNERSFLARLLEIDAAPARGEVGDVITADDVDAREQARRSIDAANRGLDAEPIVVLTDASDRECVHRDRKST